MRKEIKKIIANLPDTPGIYKFLDKRKLILYIGKAINLKKRVSSYFQNKDQDLKTKLMITQIKNVETIPVASEFEALLLEAKLIKIFLPKYNVSWKDDKHYIYIWITKEEFPRILYSRKPQVEDGIFFGPFPSKRNIREILSLIRSIFPYCTQRPKASKPCFYTHLGLCNPCPSEIRNYKTDEFKVVKRQYHKNIRQIKSLLNGKLHIVKDYLTKEMLLNSEAQRFEKAAQFREKSQILDYLVNFYHPVDAYIENPEYAKQTKYKEEKELRLILSKYFENLSNLKRIECYDVSNIFGKFASGSLVTFIDGTPAKDFYRRFKIKTQENVNDFTMLSEIMKRRFNHNEWIIPDLLVVDGGKPQLMALQKILFQMQVKIPIIGLAKEYEELVIPNKNSFVKLKLLARSPALQLLQRIRDEAHRFAHKYHQHLRLKYLLSSIKN